MLKLPNLELLEYKAKQYFFLKEENAKLLNDRVPGANRISLEAYVFPQMWGNTVLGFDVDEDGNAMFGGDMMTEAYTTVFYEPVTETYLVFFGDRICYQVQNANSEFLNDLKNHKLESLSKAKRLY